MSKNTSIHFTKHELRRKSILRQDPGFTLIEVSIVLVIIGLIIGGVLVGRDLISAAEVRATISQIEKYQTSARTFQAKYGYLPGDMPDPYASQFGFSSRLQYPGSGNGDGIIQGCDFSYSPQCGSGAVNIGVIIAQGETSGFWVDLSKAKLIDLGLTFSYTNSNSGLPDPLTYTSSPQSLSDIFPKAKIGQNNYVALWSGGYNTNSPDGMNYFAITAFDPDNGISISGTLNLLTPGLTVSQAYNIDKKTDDGLPQSGSVNAIWPFGNGNANAGILWVTTAGMANNGILAGSAIKLPAASTTCYDNGNVTGAVGNYSISA